MTPMLRKAFAGAVVVTALLLAGCGGGEDPPPPGSPSAAEFLITPAAVNAEPAGSPQRALLSWWRSIQYNDFEGYLAALAAPLRSQRQGDPRAQRDLTLVAGELIRSQPKISDVEEESSTATVFTRIETRQPIGATRFTTTSNPQGFTLVREGGEWKIADDYFVTSRANATRKALREAEEAPAGDGG